MISLHILTDQVDTDLAAVEYKKDTLDLVVNEGEEEEPEKIMLPMIPMSALKPRRKRIRISEKCYNGYRKVPVCLYPYRYIRTSLCDKEGRT